MLNNPGLSHELSEHFLQLSIAIRCLCSSTLVDASGFIRLAIDSYCLREISEASYVKLYGREQVIYRIHSRIHLADDVEC